MEIEVDNTDPWIVTFLETLSEWNVSPAEVDQVSLNALKESLTLLGQAWPETLAELQAYVHLIVPFSSDVKGASTNTSWPGVIFLNNIFREHPYNIERLVHEGSHLRLNVVMNEEILHYHNWDDYVPSPFRKGPRPVSGLYHGAFVVTRSALAMDKAFQLMNDPAYLQRIALMLNQVEQAIDTLNTQVRLSPTGRALLDEITDEIGRLRERYPAGEFKSAAVDPYLAD
jgi:HEXXH motif-containing protein